MFQPLALADADLLYAEHWLPASQADAWFAALHSGIDWEVHQIRLFGRLVASPRLSSWIGDADASYRYSGTRFEPKPWPAGLADLRAQVSAAAGERFNSVLANLYRDGGDAMGWHSDDEIELGPRPVIASLSLGASRRFLFQRRRAPGDPAPGDKLELNLGHGSLLLMRGDTQRWYRHALPRTRKPVGPRINLTFRRIAARP
jgi:alkylated DNA repair dioxygenase AlkB